MHMRNAFLITKRTIQGNGRFSSDVFRMKPKSFHSNEKNMHFSTTTIASGSTIVDFAHKGIIHFGYVDEQYSTNEIGVVTSRGERISVSRQRLLFQKELTSQERLHPHMLTDLYQTSLGHILPLYDQAEVLWKESIHEKVITVDKAANLLFKRPPTITQIYGAHRLLLDQTVYFKRQRDGTYYCHTPASVEQAYLHLFSLRKKQVHLASFLARAAHQLVRKRPEVYKDDPVILNLQSAASLVSSGPLQPNVVCSSSFIVTKTIVLR
eukprot:TRINITY_DN9136_c0_g1_i2.p1 TRINITY_DN9136_c0_g1~~TRINITY_DN9136_c0_g1_i2.p1  ORF type:complete len:266 (+),score=31.44 TRINITY_DN9136_c0_g1_i2:46-843(+)